MLIDCDSDEGPLGWGIAAASEDVTVWGETEVVQRLRARVVLLARSLARY